MRGRFGIDAEGGERYCELESERTWMPMLLDAILSGTTTDIAILSCFAHLLEMLLDAILFGKL